MHPSAPASQGPPLSGDLAARFPRFAQALHLQATGALQAARALFGELVAQPALTAACLHQLATMALQSGDNAVAADLFRHTLRLDPHNLPAYAGMANALLRLGHKGAALGVLLDQGSVLQLAGRFADAEMPYREILSRDPLSYGACVNLGTCLAQMHRLPEAAGLLLQALEIYGRVDRQVAEFHADMRARLQSAGRIPHYSPLMAGPPSGTLEKIEDALTTLGKVMTEMHCPQEAVMCHRQSLLLAPGFALAHWNLSLALLELGAFDEGWREYEWRWHWEGFPEARRRLPIRMWRGEDLQGKSILVWAEQGFGDAIQFAPLLQGLVQRGARVSFEVMSPLFRLFQNSFPDVHVIEGSQDRQTPANAIAFDYVVGQISLPAKLALQRSNLPLARSYLRAPAALLAKWALQIPRQSAPRVGVVWAGRPKPDPRRSIAFALLAPLFNRRTLRWYSLQVGTPQQDIPPAGNAAIENLAPALRDFSETAAAMAQLDLVITIDSATAHLAGALGVPVWVLLPRVADWRWAGAPSSSPWYPSMRIFRQGADGAWEPVIEAVGQALDTWPHPPKE